MRKLLLVLLSALTLNAYANDAPDANAIGFTTTAFLDQGALPVLYTCDGKNLSPELSWTNIPAKAKALAIVVTDPTAPHGTFYHWVVFNIPTSATRLDEGMTKLPAGSLAAKNSWGKVDYNGPCPPKGSAHTYIITLYALDNKLSLPANADAKDVLGMIEKHTVGKASLSTVYSRWLQ